MLNLIDVTDVQDLLLMGQAYHVTRELAINQPLTLIKLFLSHSALVACIRLSQEVTSNSEECSFFPVGLGLNLAALYGDEPGKFRIAGLTLREILGRGSLAFCQGRAFQCPVCEKVLHQRHQFVGHVNVHFNLAPFKCKKCFKTFPYQTSLARHIRIHHKETH